MRDIIAGATEDTLAAGSAGHKLVRNNDLKIYDQLELPGAAVLDNNTAYEMLEKFHTEADDPMSRSYQAIKVLEPPVGPGRNTGTGHGTGETVIKGKSQGPIHKEDPLFSSEGATLPAIGKK